MTARNRPRNFIPTHALVNPSPLLTFIFSNSSPFLSTMLTMDRKWQNHLQIAPNCPRCSSSNTKFCYYNNYSFSQPRFFCKSCRRYWTKGGSLRNVPVGGGCRKIRRAKSARLDHRSSSSYSPYSAAGDSSSSGADIDLAAVFANYLNQDAKLQPESSVAADSLTSDSDTAAVDFRPPMETGDLVGEFPNQAELSEFGLQSLLGDEMVQDALWSESDLSSSDVTWQREEFVPLIGGDDQINIPANLVVDNVWSSFDLSGF